MKVREIMHPTAITASPDMTVYDAAEKMLNEDIGFLCIGDKSQLQGTLTDRDIVLRAVAKSKDIRSTKVSEIMTANLEYCEIDADASEAARLMSEKQVRRLPVLDQNKNLVGVVSMGDLARHLDHKTAGDVLAGVTAESRPQA